MFFVNQNVGVLKNHHRQQQRRPLLKFFNDHSIFISICQKCVASSFDAIAMTKTRHKTTTHSLNSFQKKSYHYHFLFRARDLLGTSKLTFQVDKALLQLSFTPLTSLRFFVTTDFKEFSLMLIFCNPCWRPIVVNFKSMQIDLHAHRKMGIEPWSLLNL